MAIKLDFSELALDVIAGTVFGALGYVIEVSLASVSTFAAIASNASMYGAIVGLLLFIGAIFGKVGSTAYKNASS